MVGTISIVEDAVLGAEDAVLSVEVDEDAMLRDKDATAVIADAVDDIVEDAVSVVELVNGMLNENAPSLDVGAMSVIDVSAMLKVAMLEAPGS